jgi:hypothetical protein
MRTAMAAAPLAVICTDVRAQTLTECGKLDGYAFYFSGGLVPPDKSGWKKDAIDGGRVILRFINGEADLLIGNATGATTSVRQEGGRILVRSANNGLVALTALYVHGGGTAITEDYVFQLNDRGDGMVVSTVVRTASQVNKMSLMTAQCRGPR